MTETIFKGKTFTLQNVVNIFMIHSLRTLKDGYESDSTLSYRRHQFIPQQSANKSIYTQVLSYPILSYLILSFLTQVQKGGEVPHKGLRMQAPEKKGNLFIYPFLKCMWVIVPAIISSFFLCIYACFFNLMHLLLEFGSQTFII